MANHVYAAILVNIFVVVFGAMMTPVVLALTRPVHQTFQRLARRVAWNACKAALVRAARLLVAVATAGAALSLIFAVIATPAKAQTPFDKESTTVTKSIERMIGIMDKVAKSPVVQGAKVIARGYTAVKVYRLSKEVKGLKTDVTALNASMHAILTEVTGVIARIEAGEALAAAELEAVNARIDVHAIQIAAAEAEIEVLKFRMDEAERKQREQDRRQRQTDARVQVQQKQIGRESKTPNLYYDPKCQCRRDARDRDTASGPVRASAGS